ncbi:MAG: hypothetical protein Q4D04_15275 [Clostridia bacterium]|nr:hypothetical protein [Clostridia bacterium]
MLKHIISPCAQLVNESVAGCVEAIGSFNPPRHIPCVCHDLSKVSRRVLKSGLMDFVITQDMYQQGYQPLMLINDILNGKMHETGRSSISARIICDENAGEGDIY